MEKEYIPGKGEVESYLKSQNIKYENKGNNQLLLTPCPFCGGGEGGKDVYASPCYINSETGRWNCFRGSKCGAGGTFKRLQAMIVVRDAGLLTAEIQQGANIDKKLIAKAKAILGKQGDSIVVYPPNNQITEKGENEMSAGILEEKSVEKQDENKSEIYDVSQLQGLELTGACREYMIGRGISDNTCRLYNIVNSPEPDKAEKYILMPFIDSEEANVTYAKYRNINPETDANGRTEPKEKEVNGKPCFFGLQNLQEDSHTLIITEGLIDCLSLAEAGVRENGYDVVSVPNGLGNKGLTFLDDNDIDLLGTYQSVIVFGDFENGKVSLVEEFEEKLEREVKVIADYRGNKDANDILVNCGKDVLLQSVKESIVYEDSEIKHIVDVDLTADTRTVMFMTGFKETDNMLNGIESGNLILLLGKEGSGKTTIATQMLLQAANSNIKSLVYSGEMTLKETTETLFLQAAGPQYTDRLVNDRTGKYYGVVKPFAREKISLWLNKFILLYEDKTIRKDKYEKVMNPSALADRMLTVVERQVKYNGVKFVVIDNMMSALARFSEGGELYGAQAELALHLNFLCKKYDITIMLCVHSRKTDKASLHLLSDDISGSSIPKNMSDIILSYEKYKPTENSKKGKSDGGNAAQDNPPSGYLRVLKNRHWGALTKYDSDGEGIYYAALCKRLFTHDDFEKLRNGKDYPQYRWLDDNK